jgi:hypothetical protein
MRDLGILSAVTDNPISRRKACKNLEWRHKATGKHRWAWCEKYGKWDFNCGICGEA